MTLSTIAAKAMEQAKMGLLMLYGAGYFTEDEWIAIDGLIHKGRHEFTKGPGQQNSFFHAAEAKVEESLIDFADWDSSLPIQQVQNPESLSTKDFTTVFEESISPPGSSTSDLADFSSAATSNTTAATPQEVTKVPGQAAIYPSCSDLVDSSSTETLNEASAEASSDEDYDQTQTAGDNSHLFDLSANTTPVSALAKPAAYAPPARSTPQILNTPTPEEDGKENGKDTVQKGNHTSSGRPHPADPYRNVSLLGDTEPTAPGLSQLPPLPHSWASDTESKESHCPSQAKQLPAPAIKNPSPRRFPGQPAVLSAEYLKNYGLFLRYHGRAPKALSDFYQPSNPGFKGPKPPKSYSPSSSKAHSIQTKSTIKASSSSSPHTAMTPNRLLTCYQSNAKRSKIDLEIKVGDTVRVKKHVSGKIYHGENLRTKEHGQFPESVFGKPRDNQETAKLARRDPKSIPRNRHESTPQDSQSLNGESPGVGNWLDSVEEGNAAEWDKDSTASRPVYVQNASPSSEQEWPEGLAGKVIYEVPQRRDNLTELEMQEIVVGKKRAEMGEEEFNRRFEDILLIQEEFIRRNQILLEPQPRSNGLRNTPLLPVIPKTAVCWHWKTGRGCRYGAEGCRDLHGYIPSNPFDEANVRDGKASWGAFFDYHPSYLKSNFFPVSKGTKRSAGGGDGGEGVSDTIAAAMAAGKKILTCWYWGTEGYCEYNRHTCKYLHEYGDWGMAMRPRQWKENWSKWGPKAEDAKGGRAGIWKGKTPAKTSIWGQGVERTWVRGEMEGGQEGVEKVEKAWRAEENACVSEEKADDGGDWD